MRCLAAAMLLACTLLPAVEEDAVLAAARLVSAEYQTHLRILAEGLGAGDETARIGAMRALAELRDPNVVPLIMPFLEGVGHSPSELCMACTVLGRLGYQTPVPAIKGLAGHPDPEVRKAATLALQQIDALAAGDWMQRSVDPDEAMHLASTVNLGQLKHAEAVVILVAGLEHSKPLVRQASCIGLGKLGDPALAEKLRPALTDANPGVRRYAAEALAKLGATQAIPDLLMALEGNIESAHIMRALRALTGGTDFGFDPHAPLLMRQEAIDRGFAWVSAQAKPK